MHLPIIICSSGPCTVCQYTPKNYETLLCTHASFHYYMLSRSMYRLPVHPGELLNLNMHACIFPLLYALQVHVLLASTPRRTTEHYYARMHLPIIICSSGPCTVCQYTPKNYLSLFCTHASTHYSARMHLPNYYARMHNVNVVLYTHVPSFLMLPLSNKINNILLFLQPGSPIRDLHTQETTLSRQRPLTLLPRLRAGGNVILSSAS